MKPKRPLKGVETLGKRRLQQLLRPFFHIQDGLFLPTSTNGILIVSAYKRA